METDRTRQQQVVAHGEGELTNPQQLRLGAEESGSDAPPQEHEHDGGQLQRLYVDRICFVTLRRPLHNLDSKAYHQLISTLADTPAIHLEYPDKRTGAFPNNP